MKLVTFEIDGRARAKYACWRRSRTPGSCFRRAWTATSTWRRWRPRRRRSRSEGDRRAAQPHRGV